MLRSLCGFSVNISQKQILVHYLIYIVYLCLGSNFIYFLGRVLFTLGFKPKSFRLYLVILVVFRK